MHHLLWAYMAETCLLHRQVQLLQPINQPNHGNIMPNQIHNPTTYGLVRQFYTKLLNEFLVCQLPELEHKYVTHLLSLWYKVYCACSNLEAKTLNYNSLKVFTKTSWRCFLTILHISYYFWQMYSCGVHTSLFCL